MATSPKKAFVSTKAKVKVIDRGDIGKGIIS